MKLRKRKITIISKLIGIIFLMGIMPVFANSFGVSLKKENGKEIYFIETKVENTNRSRDSRIAPLYAKSQLLKYLKQRKNIVSVDLKHFTLLKVKKYEEYSLFLFKVDKNNVIYQEAVSEKEI